MEVIKITFGNRAKIINKLAQEIKGGRVVVFPTDTVYGLLCDSANRQAAERIFKIKERPRTKPLAVFVKNIEAAKKIAHISGKQEKILENSSVTAILRAKNKKLSPLVYKNNTIGVRIPSYGLLNLLLEKYKKPLAQTSANISGRPATTKMKEVLNQFAKKQARPNLVINAGDLPKAKPSKIIDLTGEKTKVLRK